MHGCAGKRASRAVHVTWRQTQKSGAGPAGTLAGLVDGRLRYASISSAILAFLTGPQDRADIEDKSLDTVPATPRRS